jgi:hypothetical protein
MAIEVVGVWPLYGKRWSESKYGDGTWFVSKVCNSRPFLTATAQQPLSGSKA